MHENTEVTGQLGVNAVGLAVSKLGWSFHPNSSPEYGIDGEIEVVEGERRSGKILKVQIKSGHSWFKESTPLGFIYRGDDPHIRYWLGHAVPVLIMLHDPTTELTYWENIEPSKIYSTGSGWKIEVPHAQLLDANSAHLLRGIANRVSQVSTVWVRYPRYKLSRGYIQATSTGDPMEYDPWRLYSSGRHSAGWQPPYMSLVNLARQIGWAATSGIAPTEATLTETEKASILDWTASYGLLGLLPGLAQMITLWPRWESRHKIYNSETVAGACEGYTRYIRMGGCWYSSGMMRDSYADEVPAVARVVGEPVSKALIPADWPVPGVLRWSHGLFNWEEESLTKGLGSYFPDVPGSREEYFYPRPGEPRFWMEYAEHLSYFIIWTKNFYEALTEISGFSPAQPNDLQAVRANEAMYLLESLASSVSTTIEIETGSRRFLKKWRSPSLLSSFAMMAIEDMAAGYWVRICQTCSGAFCTNRETPLCDNCGAQAS